MLHNAHVPVHKTNCQSTESLRKLAHASCTSKTRHAQATRQHDNMLCLPKILTNQETSPTSLLIASQKDSTPSQTHPQQIAKHACCARTGRRNQLKTCEDLHKLCAQTKRIMHKQRANTITCCDFLNPQSNNFPQIPQCSPHTSMQTMSVGVRTAKYRLHNTTNVKHMHTHTNTQPATAENQID